MKKRILMLTPVPSHPQTAGNRARIYNLACSIKELGHELYFAHVQRETGDNVAMQQCWGGNFFFPISYKKPNKLIHRIRKKLKSYIDSESKYNYHIDAWYDDSIDKYLKELHRQFNFDVVIVEYVFFSKALLCFPNHVLKIIDTHDVLTDRYKIYLQNNNRYNWFSTTAKQERKGLNRADTIIAIQEVEKEFFKRLAKSKTITVGHMVKTKKMEIETLPKRNILFIGSANQSNIDALNFFIDDMFPTIKVAVPEATLLVAGPVGRVNDRFGKDIINLGEPSCLDSTYDEADIVINPIRYGSGLKIKNIEALGYSKPLVTTSIGSAGMESGIGTAFLVGDNAQAFSDCVIDIFGDTTLFRSLSKNGYDFSINWNREQTNALQSILT